MSKALTWHDHIRSRGFSGNRECRETYRLEKRWEMITTAVECVMDSVHPSQFSALPPSPEEVKWKALQTGIITSEEWAKW